MPIYESPDGGKTVYEREFGSNERTEISSPEFTWNQYMKEHNWDELSSDPSIRHTLERLKLIVTLCNE